ncbi:MAG: hypothetical protein WCR52_01650 [Bacteroidota bacterium]
MPTIEIAVPNARGIDINEDDYDFDLVEESEMISHRSLFYDFLREKKGSIIHIGSPGHKHGDGGYHGGALINWHLEDPDLALRKKGLKSDTTNSYANQDFIFQFLPAYRKQMELLLEAVMSKSAGQTVYFLTDYQFGPEKAGFVKYESVSAFWAQHDHKYLLFNTMYEIGSGGI